MKKNRLMSLFIRSIFLNLYFDVKYLTWNKMAANSQFSTSNLLLPNQLAPCYHQNIATHLICVWVYCICFSYRCQSCSSPFMSKILFPCYFFCRLQQQQRCSFLSSVYSCLLDAKMGFYGKSLLLVHKVYDVNKFVAHCVLWLMLTRANFGM